MIAIRKKKKLGSLFERSFSDPRLSLNEPRALLLSTARIDQDYIRMFRMVTKKNFCDIPRTYNLRKKILAAATDGS